MWKLFNKREEVTRNSNLRTSLKQEWYDFQLKYFWMISIEHVEIEEENDLAGKSNVALKFSSFSKKLIALFATSKWFIWVENHLKNLDWKDNVERLFQPSLV